MYTWHGHIFALIVILVIIKINCFANGAIIEL